MTLVILARALLLLLEVLLALPLLYLALLVLGAAGAAGASLRRASSKQSAITDPASTFAILVPAHNEELLIGKTLASLAQLDYPKANYKVHVIADNCSDSTADIVRAAGVSVLERSDEVNRGKGHALAWAMAQLMPQADHADAYIILDADTVVDAGLLRALARGLARGLARKAKALQSHNAVLNAAESSTSALRWLALSLVNYIRPLGRNAWGGSSTLTGNGMCLTHALLEEHPWQAFGLSEDYQYYLTLVAAGEKVLFVPDANVRSVMPTTARQLQSQDIRWETLSPDSSRWQRRISWQLFVDGIRQHSWVRLDALAELLTPPLSVLAGGSFVLLVAALLLGAPLQLWLAVALVAMLLAYVGSAFALLHPPLGVYRALVYAPAYILRKLWIFFVLRRLRKNTNTWVRTARTAPVSGDSQP